MIGHRLAILHGAHRSGEVLAAMTVAALLDMSWRLARGRGYGWSEAGATLGVAAGNLVLGALSAAVVGAVYAAAWRLSPLRWPTSDWRTWAAGFVVVEFAYYWFHRLSHEVAWLWASHAVHHTPAQMTLLSAIRLGWTNLFSLGWLIYLPVILAGFDPRLVLALLAFDLHYQFFLHTEATGALGPLEGILNTPSHHRVHHARNLTYRDRNFGGVVIVFDRLFGTYVEERHGDPPIYGLVHPLPGRRPWILALGEWGRLFSRLSAAPSVAAAARLALGRPAEDATLSRH
jgi:sterol desaturase/sphingolipid hydroxylase (fatty acid hydroxylase superfamily)